MGTAQKDFSTWREGQEKQQGDDGAAWRIILHRAKTVSKTQDFSHQDQRSDCETESSSINF